VVSTAARNGARRTTGAGIATVKRQERTGISLHHAEDLTTIYVTPEQADKLKLLHDPEGGGPCDRKDRLRSSLLTCFLVIALVDEPRASTSASSARFESEIRRRCPRLRQRQK
jgi:hypothetical protein